MSFSYQLILVFLVSLVLAFVIQFIFFNRSYHKKLLNTCQQFKLLAEEIFLCLIDPGFYEQQFFFERSLHARKNQLLTSLLALREQVALRQLAERANDAEIKLMKNFDCLLAILLEVSQLRHRVVEASVLKLCQEEMIQVWIAINQLFNLMMDNLQSGVGDEASQHSAIFECAKAIKRFEEKDQHVLRISTPEPMVFTLFLVSVRDLYNHLIENIQLMFGVAGR